MARIWQELLSCLEETAQDPPSQETLALSQTTGTIMTQSVPLVWFLLKHEDVDVSKEVFPVRSNGCISTRDHV